MLRLLPLGAVLLLAGAEAGRITDLYRIVSETSGDNLGVMPLGRDGEPVIVDLRLHILSISDVDKENNRVSMVVWKKESWSNPDISWSPQRYLNLSTINLASERIWVPDTAIYNAADVEKLLSPDLVVVSSDGDMTYVPGLKITVPCDVSGVDSCDGSTCKINFGSWTFNANLLTLVEPDEASIDLTYFDEASKYEIVSTDVKRIVKRYKCCPEPYENLEFYFTFKDKSGGRRQKKKLLKSLLLDD